MMIIATCKEDQNEYDHPTTSQYQARRNGVGVGVGVVLGIYPQYFKSRIFLNRHYEKST